MMAKYIDIPQNLDRSMLEQLFGHDAVSYYLERIEQRKREGKIYYHPFKTVYLWALEDKRTNRGFYSSYRGYSAGRKRKNYGGS